MHKFSLLGYFPTKFSEFSHSGGEVHSDPQQTEGRTSAEMSNYLLPIPVLESFGM